MKYDLSICMPAYRTDRWESLYESAKEAVGPYTWEMVLVGPNDPPPSLAKKTNFKFFKDYGTPSRCGQIATMLSEGELMVHGSDDGTYIKDSLRECIAMHKDLGHKDFSYWKAWTHPDLRLPGVPKDAFIGLVTMHNLEYFRSLGGWDCRFEHLNMNLHDLHLRAQRDGAKFYYSPGIVLGCEWSWNWPDSAPIQAAYKENDAPLFTHMYSQPREGSVEIDYFNWIKSDSVWKRRFNR